MMGATVLLVCSGNVCRSPLAEQLLRARLEEKSALFEVVSAGVIAEDGAPMDRDAAEQSVRFGGLPDGHRARLLTPVIAARADLVLTAERAHRAAVVSMAPSASTRTFTIRQFARIVSSLTPEDLAAVAGLPDLVAVTARLRGVAAGRPEEDDIEDPYLRGSAVHAAIAESVIRAIDPIAMVLRQLAAQPQRA